MANGVNTTGATATGADSDLDYADMLWAAPPELVAAARLVCFAVSAATTAWRRRWW
jgi:hypothetical protein